MRPLDFSNGPIRITEENIRKINELFQCITDKKEECNNEFWNQKSESEKQIDIKIHAKYDAMASTSAIIEVFNALNIFGLDSSNGIVTVDSNKEYFITPETIGRLGMLMDRNFGEQIKSIRIHVSTRERESEKYEIRVLECIERLIGYMKALKCVNLMIDAKEKSFVIIDDNDEEAYNDALNLFESNREKIRKYVIQKLNNYSQFVKALISLEDARDELRLQSKDTIDVSEYSNRVKECEDVVQRLKEEYEEIDREDKIFGNSVVGSLHSEQLSSGER